jgi:hypothetical protein
VNVQPSLVLKRLLLSFSLAAAAIGGQFSGNAQGAETAHSDGSQDEPGLTAQADAQEAASLPSEVPKGQVNLEQLAIVSQRLQEPPVASAPVKSRQATIPPVPGKALTSASGFLAQAAEPLPNGSEAPINPVPVDSAPLETSAAVETRYRFSYVGFGVNLGAGSGDTALGEVSFAAFSKFAFSPHFSFRPAVLVSNDVSFLLPVTYDFPNRGPGSISPYAGVGAMFSTGRSGNADLLLTAGLDYPLNPELAVTASVNLAPLNKFDIGFIIGLAYTFGTETITTPAISLRDIVPSRPPRQNPSYFGGGVNFGAGGGTALGRISGAIYSKIALGSYFSFRPGLLISRNLTFLLPVTYDFDVIALSDYIRLAPYAGIGAAFSTGNNNNADLLLTGGFDIPITDQIAATVGVNVGPIDRFNIGFLLGVAYTFGPFAR